MAVLVGDKSVTEELLLGFRFGVFFLGGIAGFNSLDMRFQKVTGLTTSIETEPIDEGGQNLYTQQLPSQVKNDNVVLSRGLVLGSPLNAELNVATSLLELFPTNVLIILFSSKKIPMASWLLTQAFPVRWSISDLDAQERGLVIEDLELTYGRRHTVRI